MLPARPRARALRWLAGALAIAALAQLMLTVWAAWSMQHELPRWDDLKVFWQDLGLAPGELGLAELFGQQNEHRLPFPRLFFRADLLCTQGSGALLVASLLTLQLLHVLVLVAIFGHRRDQSLAAKVIFASLATLMLFSCHQLENFVWRIQISSVLVYLAVSLAFWLLLACEHNRARHRRLRAMAYGLACLLTAFVANYSRADGNLIWPLLAVAAWRLAMPRWFVCLVVAVGTLSVGAYFWSYESPPRQTSPFTVLAHGLPRAAVFVLVFLGAQVPNFGVVTAGIVGAVGVLLGAPYVVGVATRRITAPAAVACVAVMLFACGSAAVTALGRSLAVFDAALAFRYATPALLFWAALLGLLVASLAHGQPRGRAPRAGLWSAIIAFVAVGLAQQSSAIAAHEPTRRGLEQATMAVLSRVNDPPAVFHLSEPVPLLAEIVELLRTRRVAVFRHGTHELLGQALPQRAASGGGTARTGALTDIETLPSPSGGVRVRGWVSTYPDTTAVAPIVLTDRDIVVGFASCKIEPRRADGRIPWIGYARTLGREPPVLQAHVLLGDGDRVRSLAGTIAAPPGEDLGSDSLASAILRSVVGPPPASFHREYMTAIAPIAAAVGHPLPAANVAAAPLVEGAVDAVEAVPGLAGAVRLRGWVAAAAAARHRTVLILDPHNRVVGGGTTSPPAAEESGDRRAWNAWAVNDETAPIPTAFFTGAGGAVRLQMPDPIDPRAVVPAHALAAVIDVDATITGQWAAPGSLTWFLPLPDASPVSDSWAGSDRHQGRCALGPIAVDGSRSLGVPVLIGPDATGQTVHALDATTGEILATLDAVAWRGCWRVWRVPLAGDGRRSVVLLAEDRGSEYGQWLAWGRPHWLRP